jgi:hypothetical protein
MLGTSTVAKKTLLKRMLMSRRRKQTDEPDTSARIKWVVLGVDQVLKLLTDGVNKPFMLLTLMMEYQQCAKAHAATHRNLNRVGAVAQPWFFMLSVASTR